MRNRGDMFLKSCLSFCCATEDLCLPFPQINMMSPTIAQHLDLHSGGESTRELGDQCLCHLSRHHPHSHPRSQASWHWPPPARRSGPRQEALGRLRTGSCLQSGRGCTSDFANDRHIACKSHDIMLHVAASDLACFSWRKLCVSDTTSATQDFQGQSIASDYDWPWHYWLKSLSVEVYTCIEWRPCLPFRFSWACKPCQSAASNSRLSPPTLLEAHLQIHYMCPLGGILTSESDMFSRASIIIQMWDSYQCGDSFTAQWCAVDWERFTRRGIFRPEGCLWGYPDLATQESHFSRTWYQRRRNCGSIVRNGLCWQCWDKGSPLPSICCTTQTHFWLRIIEIYGIS